MARVTGWLKALVAVGVTFAVLYMSYEFGYWISAAADTSFSKRSNSVMGHHQSDRH